jgi:protein-disulfide isomerase
MLARRFLFAAGLSALALPAAALDLNAMTDAEREAFRAEVRAYLLENPEVLTEAIAVLEQQEELRQIEEDRALVAQNLALIQDDGHSWVGGNPEGDITVVEFMDYRCGYCRRASPEVAQLVEGDGDIRFVVKEFPILGPQSEMASRFAIAVQQIHGDDAYKDVHDALIALEADIDSTSLTRLAEALVLDPAPIFEQMDSAEVSAVIDANYALGEALGISGTPTFVMGDQMVRGYVPLPTMEAIVAQEREG